MRRSKSKLLGFAAAFLLIACGSQGMSKDELKEFAALERALDTLAGAPAEDRDIRLKELEGLAVGAERLKKLKKTCVESYREFIQAVKLLEEARKKTQKTEAAVAEVRAENRDGGTLDETQRARIQELSKKAASSLSEVNHSLDKAEKLVNECDKARSELRAIAESSI